MTYITKISLARQGKLYSGETANLFGSIKLGEDLTISGSTYLKGLGENLSSENLLVIDSDKKVFTFPLSGITTDSYTKSESDNRFVHLTDDETIDGNKTFSLPVSGVPAVNNDELVTLSQITGFSNYFSLSGNVLYPTTLNNRIHVLVTSVGSAIAASTIVNGGYAFQGDGGFQGIGGFFYNNSPTTPALKVDNNSGNIAEFGSGTTTRTNIIYRDGRMSGTRALNSNEFVVLSQLSGLTGNYIVNGSSLQTGATFNIDGNGAVGGTYDIGSTLTLISTPLTSITGHTFLVRDNTSGVVKQAEIEIPEVDLSAFPDPVDFPDFIGGGDT